MGTLTFVWDLKNHLHIRPKMELFVLRFTNQEVRCHIMNRGLWFYCRSHFVLIDDLIEEAYPSDFQIRCIKVDLTLKYERIVEFCWVCGLLEHAAVGYGGPPDISRVQVVGVDLIVSSSGAYDAAAGKGKGIINLNPNLNSDLGRGSDFCGSSL
ncbi:hypothetical protein ACLB2K_045672 [Fragaria x ananassa]